MTSVDRRFEKMFRQEDRSRERDDLGKYAANESYLRPNRHHHERTKHEESKMASHCVRRITCGDQRRKTVCSIVPWVDSRSRQLIVATRRKLSRPRFLGHEIRAGARKGKKNQRKSLRHDLGSLLVPAVISDVWKKLEYWRKKTFCGEKKVERTLGPVSIVRLTFEGDIWNGCCVQKNFTAGTETSSCSMPTEQLDSSSRFLSHDGPRLSEYLSTKR